MSIVFGHNNFVIKRVSPKELGLENNPEMKNAEIQLIQKYAHLYFIPVFPIGQEWVLRRDGKSYHLINDLQHKLLYRYPSRVHVGAFALPIILILGLLGYTGYEKISQYQSERRYAAEMEEKSILLNKQLDSIDNKNSVIFSFESDSYSDENYSVLKREGDKFLIQKISGEGEMNTPNFIDYHLASKDEENTNDSIWITKQEIIKAIPSKEPFSKKQISALGKSLMLSNIYIIREAYFKEDTPDEAKSSLYNEFVNYGKNAVIDSLVPSSKSEDWKLSKTKTVNFKERFAIKTESRNSATLYYHTVPDNIQHTLKVNNHKIENKGDQSSYNY
ncbi:hypothetical protein [Chryseobacterium luquanense]|uniref:Uncharacterized protein n=1 Tax=Chryseobacterium luquanense TaxID=2983766 RepID=A0ABT3Y5S7_9FLAO|nr:hypothetical protein [Chryseobacterium luquanense]MCX8533505.1 hypothetical protein [Chryseobacterium luquanense]